MATYTPKKPRLRDDGVPDKRFRNRTHGDYKKSLKVLTDRVAVLKLQISELEQDYERAVLANYRLVMWAKSQGLTIPSTNILEKKYDAKHLKARRNGPGLV